MQQNAKFMFLLYIQVTSSHLVIWIDRGIYEYFSFHLTSNVVLSQEKFVLSERTHKIETTVFHTAYLVFHLNLQKFLIDQQNRP